MNTYHTGEAVFSAEEYKNYNEEFRNENLFHNDFTNLSLPTTSSIDQDIAVSIQVSQQKTGHFDTKNQGS